MVSHLPFNAQMPRGRTLLLGILSVLPALTLPVCFIVLLLTLTPDPPSAASAAPLTMGAQLTVFVVTVAMPALFMLCTLILGGMALYYIIHAARSPSRSALWIVSLILAPIFAVPAYWLLKIRSAPVTSSGQQR